MRKVVAAATALLALTGCGRAVAREHPDPPRYRVVVVTIRFSHFSPSRLSFPVGTTVDFVVHNEDPIEHEFIVGDPAVQYYIEHTAHPEHDGSVAGQISVPPGQTRTTTYTLDKVEPMLFACHVHGHYAYGMHGPIVITT